jgi:hypothetical protein
VRITVQGHHKQGVWGTLSLPMFGCGGTQLPFQVTQEAEIERIIVPGQSGQKSKTLSPK